MRLELFTSNYQFFWGFVLALGLWLPLRHLIWVMSARRFLRKNLPIDETVQKKLKTRAGIIAALIAPAFSLIYTDYLFRM